MALFNRKKDVQEPEIRQNTQENTEQESYTVPTGLDFLIPYLGKGEITAISTFFGGIQLISSTIASIPIHVRKISDGSIVNHAINDAFDNSLQSRYTIMKQIIWDLYLKGNAVLYIKRASDGTPIELIYCPPGTYTIMYNEIKRELYYLITNIQKRKIEPINVIHLVLNSKDGINGKGLPLYAAKLIEIALATDNHAKNYFQNGANIDGILKSTKPLTSAQKTDIKQSWQTVHGAGKQGGIAVVGNDMEYVPIGNTANDSQMIESRRFNAEEVCRYLCIDPILLGISGASAYNALEEAQLSFLSHCIYPLISMIEDEFNRKLIKPSEKGKLYVDFDENHVMFADKTATANYYGALVKNGIMTINEARHNLDLPPKDGADDLIIPFTNLDQNTIGNDKNTENEDE